MERDKYRVRVNEETYLILKKLAKEQGISMAQLTMKLIIEEQAYRNIYGYEGDAMNEQANEEESQYI